MKKKSERLEIDYAEWIADYLRSFSLAKQLYILELAKAVCEHNARDWR